MYWLLPAGIMIVGRPTTCVKHAAASFPQRLSIDWSGTMRIVTLLISLPCAVARSTSRYQLVSTVAARTSNVMRRPCRSVDVTIAALAPAATASETTSTSRARTSFIAARPIEAQLLKRRRLRM
jgi:hypothetical protein